ncbi:MAG: oxygen-independent coproporphyrinogen III oxidase [Pseudomonadota bacterium]
MLPKNLSRKATLDVKVGWSEETTMKSEWQSFLKVRAPRYTSYPTALEFSEKVGGDQYEEALGSIQTYEPVSVYVHIPFCRQLCWYCGCNMRVENRYSRALDYVGALTDEISTVGRMLGGKGRPSSVHFGGGTPNYLLPNEIGSILSAIETNIGLTDDASLAIELDPRILRDNDADELAELGFKRMSLGIQDFDEDVQTAINRVQSFDLIEAAVGAIRGAGVTDLAFDLVYGLPKQTTETFQKTIDMTLALSPDRISVFGYAHLPSVIKRQSRIDEQDLPSNEVRAELASLADERFTSAGYHRIGFDHYARLDNPLAQAVLKGRLHRNFQGFTDDVAKNLIGLGASSISFVDGLYAQNEKGIQEYSEKARNGGLATAKGTRRSSVETVAAEAINSLLCDFYTDLTALKDTISSSVFKQLLDNLKPYEDAGIVARDANLVTLNPEAFALARAVAFAIDPSAATKNQFTRAV